MLSNAPISDAKKKMESDTTAAGRSAHKRVKTCTLCTHEKKNYGNKLPQANDINLAGLMNKYSN